MYETWRGINGGLAVGEPNLEHVILRLDVVDIDAALETSRRHGGSVSQERSAIPAVGHYAEITDTEGNHFGIMQQDASAE